MRNLKEKEIKEIEKFQTAFNMNFEPITILVGSDRKYYIYNGHVKLDEMGRTEEHTYINYCNNTGEINAWFQGCIQANNKIITARREEFDI